MDAISASYAKSVGLAKSVRETSGSVSAGSNVYATVLSITGKGVVFQMGFFSGVTTHKFRITIDGGTPMVIDTSAADVYPRSTNTYVVAFNVPFESSFLVEFTQAGASTSGQASVIWGDR